MSVNYLFVTGTTVRIWSGLVRRISALTRFHSVSCFKIGISNDPNRRWGQAYKYSYDEMWVLYRSSSINNVSVLESHLIDYYAFDCDNINAGGGGHIGTPPYYLYLVRKHR
jgi:hypothetical protein